MAPLLNPWLLDLELTFWLFWFGSTAEEEDEEEEVGWAADGEEDEVCVEVMTVFDADIIEVMTDTWVVGLDDEVDELDEVELDDVEVELEDVELDEELVELELVDVELEVVDVELELVEVDEVLVELELVELEPPWELDPSSSSVSSSPFV